ncbi:hypothetical protein [Leptothermofonsia sp. ETS-13]
MVQPLDRLSWLDGERVAYVILSSQTKFLKDGFYPGDEHARR